MSLLWDLLTELLLLFLSEFLLDLLLLSDLLLDLDLLDLDLERLDLLCLLLLRLDSYSLLEEDLLYLLFLDLDLDLRSFLEDLRFLSREFCRPDFLLHSILCCLPMLMCIPPNVFPCIFSFASSASCSLSNSTNP